MSFLNKNVMEKFRDKKVFRSFLVGIDLKTKIGNITAVIVNFQVVQRKVSADTSAFSETRD